MKITHQTITIKSLTENYQDSQEHGVTAYNNLLDVRPAYQREFVYKDKQREAVIDTVIKGYPLNVMYWAVNGDRFEIIDGQQRTISICQYVTGVFSFNQKYFHNLTDDEKENILNYELIVYLCEGTDSEKLNWFKTINIAGEKLTEQELRNAVYSGSFVTDAKKYFSKTGCPAYNIANNYMNGTPIKQDYLETVLRWYSNDNIEGYMAKNQHESNANELWLYFNSVINWLKVTFPKYRKEMKGLEWGVYYNIYSQNKYNPIELDKLVEQLMLDDDVTNKKGIYEYVLSGKEKHLNIRAFSEKQKREVYERQHGICRKCNNHFTIEEMEADHIIPWSDGGKTSIDNCQMLCREDNRAKSNK